MLDNLIFDRTAADVAARNAKGMYRYTDMNRVQNAVATVRQRYLDAGYDPTEYTLTTWSENDIPRTTRAEQYLGAVKAFDGIVPLWETVRLPANMNRLDYNGANAIERLLYLTDAAMDNIENTWWYCNEIYSGEVDM